MVIWGMEEDQIMKIMVTGATGFLGFDLTRRLVEEGHEVVCSVRKTSDKAKLQALKVSIVEADITDGRAVSDCVAMVRPDIVYHCAARVWDADEKKLFVDNVTGTSEVCGACFRHRVGKFIYLSSVSVVSGNEGRMVTDNMGYKSSDAYGRSKAEAEKIVISYRNKGLKTSIIRPCMVYGENEPHALDNIIKAIMQRRIPLLNVPEMDTELVLAYISNVTDVMILAMCKEEALNGTFIVADKEIITIRKFIEIIADEISARKPMVIPGWIVRLAEMLPPVARKTKRIFKSRTYDISRIRDVLGYIPRVSTEEGLRRTARHWKMSVKS